MKWNLEKVDNKATNVKTISNCIQNTGYSMLNGLFTKENNLNFI